MLRAAFGPAGGFTGLTQAPQSTRNVDSQLGSVQPEQKWLQILEGAARLLTVCPHSW